MIERLIPKDYRYFVGFASPSALKVIDWKRGIRDLGQMSKGLVRSEELARYRFPLSDDSKLIGADLDGSVQKNYKEMDADQK